MDIADDVKTEPANSILVTQMDSSRAAGKTLWEGLALAAIKQAFREAVVGDYSALCWLVTEGRDWLAALGLSPWVLDRWEARDLPD